MEHPFNVVKRLWGHAKVRYRGIAKNLAQMHTLFALANLLSEQGRSGKAVPLYAEAAAIYRANSWLTS